MYLYASEKGRSAVAAHTAPPSSSTQVLFDLGPMQNQIRKLEEENAHLKATLAEKEKLLGETIVKHQDELVSLRTLADRSQRAESVLQSKYESLLEKYGALQVENAALKSSLAALQAEVEKLKVVIKDLQTRDHPIAVREAMRVLEGHICLAIAGSKTKARKSLYTLKLVSASTDPTIQASYQRFMQEYHLTTDHADILGFLKDNGDAATHDKRPLLTRDELLNLVQESSNEEEKAITRDLVLLLDTFAFKDSDGKLLLKSPL